MKYIVLRDEYLNNLVDEVNKKIKDGWKPQGGICVRIRYYYQAMIKE